MHRNYPADCKGAGLDGARHARHGAASGARGAYASLRAWGEGSLCLALTELRFSALARGRFAAAACGFSAAARVR